VKCANANESHDSGSVWLLAMMLSTRACAGARWSCMPNLWCGDSEQVTPGFQSMTVYAALGHHMEGLSSVRRSRRRHRYDTRVESMTQLVSQVCPPSMENACSQCAVASLMPLQMKRTKTGRPSNVSSQ
jgi:hypothetical protein